MAKPTQRRRRTIRLTVVPEPKPDTRTVLDYQGEGTVVIRSDDGPPITMVCGKCGAPLVQGVEIATIVSIVFRCNSCGAFNDSIV